MTVPRDVTRHSMYHSTNSRLTSRDKRNTDDRCPSNDDQVDLVRLVSDREVALRDQYRRLQEVEAEIERYELRLHQDRCNELGTDYVYTAFKSHLGDVIRDTDNESTTTRVKYVPISRPELEKSPSNTNSLNLVRRLSTSGRKSPMQTNRMNVQSTTASDDKLLSGQRNRKLLNTVKSSANKTIIDDLAFNDNNDGGNSSIKHDIEVLRQQIQVEIMRGAELDCDVTIVINCIKKCEQDLHQKTSYLAELFSIVNSFDNLSPARNTVFLLTREDLRKAIDNFKRRASASTVALANVTQGGDGRSDVRTIHDDALRKQFATSNYHRTQAACSKRQSAMELDRISTSGEVRIRPESVSDRPMKSIGVHRYDSGHLWSDRFSCSSPRLLPVERVGCGGHDDEDTGIGSLQDDEEAYCGGLVTLV